MWNKIKPFVFLLSLVFNLLFVSVLLTASLSKNKSLFFYSPEDSYTTAAAIVSIPPGSKAVFESVEITLKPGETAYLQFAVLSLKKQGTLLINALYDPEIINVEQTGAGIEIIALKEGHTLMQTLTNDGIKNVALILVEK